MDTEPIAIRSIAPLVAPGEPKRSSGAMHIDQLPTNGDKVVVAVTQSAKHTVRKVGDSIVSRLASSLTPFKTCAPLVVALGSPDAH